MIIKHGSKYRVAALQAVRASVDSATSETPGAMPEVPLSELE